MLRSIGNQGETTMTKNSEQLRNEAAAHETARNESFERCDTDGFLSQWAHGLSAELKREQATILENDGKAEFWGLYEGDRRVIAKLVTNTFNYNTVTSWLLDKAEAEKFGRKYIPLGENSRIQKKLGLSERKEIQNAGAKMDGRGTGLSGTAWVATYRIGDQWGREAELKKGD
jgi:hypothetical protein